MNATVPNSGIFVQTNFGNGGDIVAGINFMEARVCNLVFFY